jgi:hypothetical protein
VSVSPPPLPETLGRLDATVAERGPDRDDVLVARAPSYRGAPPRERVRAPLTGGTSSGDRGGTPVRGRPRARYGAYGEEAER